MARILRNKKLIYLGVILCFFFSSIGCIIPFLTLHMRHLGFTLWEISVINTVSAFISLLGPVLGGTYAERYSKHKLISITCILIAAFAYTAITFIPRYDKFIYRPLVDFSCTSGIRVERCVNWDTCEEALTSFKTLTTIQLTGCAYQCRTKSNMHTFPPLHVCFHGNDGNICVVYESNSGNSSKTAFETEFKAWTLGEELKENNTDLNGITLALLKENDYDYKSKGGLIKYESTQAQISLCSYHPSSPIFFNNKYFDSISCRPKVDECNVYCHTSFSSQGSPVFPRFCEETSGDPSSTYWNYLFLRCIGDLCLLTSVCLLDSLMVTATSDYDGAYGRIHTLSALGMAIFSPFSGALLDHFTEMEEKIDFSPSAFLAAGFALLTCTLITILPIVCKREFFQFQYLSNTIKGNFFSVEMVALLIIVLVLGVQWSIIYTFLSWMTYDVGCSGMQTGLACTVAFGFSLPFLLISKNVVRNIGKANLLVFAMLFYGTRYAGVSFVLFPWWTMPFAAMETFTLCIMWISAVAYGQYLSPPGYHLVTQYLLNILHFGVGRGFGTLLGGLFISQYGLRKTFRGIALWSVISGLFYLGLYHFIIRRKRFSGESRFRVTLNESWHPLRDRQFDGGTRAHEQIAVDQNDDISLPAGITSSHTK